MRGIGRMKPALKLVLLLCLSAGVGIGCAKANNGPLKALTEPSAPVTVAGIDASGGGLKVSVLELLPDAGDNKLQAAAVPEMRAQTFVSFHDASWQWERKAPPGLLLIGEEWVRAHGFTASWAKQVQKLGLVHGRKPLVAIASGTAENFMRNAERTRGGMQALAQAQWTQDPLQSRSYGQDDDLVLPFLTDSNEAGASKSIKTAADEPVQAVQAALIKQGRLIGVLAPQQSAMLACLQGDGHLPQLDWQEAEDGSSLSLQHYKLTDVSCKSTVSSNGDLQHAKLHVTLNVHGQPASTGKASGLGEQALNRALSGVVRQLQEQEVDPLHLGDSLRKQYAGIWSPDRWRTAYAKADILLEVQVN
ncbi:Ger(x)C family spore germination C-terminal domain-containing protein [Paenibacillus cremeus]|uniref:Spore germination GerAC-like C-terminal domain-containing protein n=1 Tax=Paenibacillus cremeus TaxID=2163881 RepID=A0A559KI96_9BACL|nr:Ger(x)C family spore germination C-terminal domain-containing protein [Paenibacillus cremeus]TVY11863.1 hypothetical protein FPZ49_00800 [Paenibacillus cremeus]